MQPTSVIFKTKIKKLTSSVAARREITVVGRFQEKHLSSPKSEIPTLALPEKTKAVTNAFPSNWQREKSGAGRHWNLR